jgi:hypothetical protein
MRMTAVSVTTPPLGDDRLAKPERALLAAAATGTLVDLRSGNPSQDNPANGADWDASRVVRAEFLARLLMGEMLPESGRVRAVKLAGARISGTLDLEACTLVCTVLLRDCSFAESVILTEAEAVSIRLPGCHLPSLRAGQLRTTASAEFDAGFTVSGGVTLQGAHIGGHVNFNGATLDNPGGPALNADSLTVVQGMTCQDGFTAHGEVRLTCAHIGGVLSFNGATLDNPGRRSLNAALLAVEQSMLCQEFTAHGHVRLMSARIGGVLSFNGATLDNPGRRSLNADRLITGQSMLCRDGFNAHGEVRLRSGHIGGQLSFTGATLSNPDGLAIDLRGVNIIGSLLLPKTKPSGAIDLTQAKTASLHDHQDGWPDVLHLRGFAYDSLANDKISCAARLEWAERHPSGFTPQVYEQLGDCYRRAGDDASARKVLVAKQRHRRRKYSPLSWLWLLTVGYGYRTWQALIWLAGLAVAGTVVYGHAHMTAVTAHPPAFQPFIYTLDVLVPVVGLGQKAAWQPNGGPLVWFNFALTVAGWALATAVVAGLSGVLKRTP